MWIVFALCSACLLGAYDIAKKQALKKNGILWILFFSTAVSTLLLCRWLSHGDATDHLRLIIKASLVTTSWISGLIGLKYLPITTASTIKASRPMFVVLFSLILFKEKLNLWQWGGVVTVLSSLFLLSFTSKKEGIDFSRNKGVAAMVVSVFAGMSSALWDKHIISGMEPLFVQSWSNLYITLLLGLCLCSSALFGKGRVEKFHFDWTLVLIAVIISISDALYFFAIKQDGSLLSVISLIRRASVIVTFALGAVIFKEKNVAAKAGVLGVLLAGMVLLVIGSA